MNDVQVNSGPPVVAQRPQTTQTARVQLPVDMPKSTEQAERIEVVRELVDDLTRLSGFVTEADDRLTRLQAELHEDTPPGARAVWEGAAGELRMALALPVQLSPGDRPVSLHEAATAFRHWAEVFAENAVGPGGEGLHDDPERLAAFQEKLEALDPPVTVLAHRLRNLLARHDLDVDVLTRQASQAAAVVAADADRLTRLDPLIAELKGSWTKQLSEATTQAAELGEQLARANQTTSSPELKTDADAGLKAINALPLDRAQQTLGTIIEWATKWHDEPSFTATTLAERIQSELAEPTRTVREQLAHVTQQFSPRALAAREALRQAEQAKTATAATDQLLAGVRDRYQALVALRRQKLGSEPDERYFGAVAKSVNDAITQLAVIETELVSNSQLPPAGEAGTTDNSQATPNTQITKRVDELLKETEPYVRPTQLETVLTVQAAVLAEAKAAAATRAASKPAPAETRAPPQAVEPIRNGPARITELGYQIHRLGKSLHSALAYATALEPILPARAATQYALLERLTTTSVDLGERRLTLAELVRQPDQANRYLEQALAPDRSSAMVEHELTALETLLKPTGLAEALLEQLAGYQREHPLDTLEARHGQLHTLRGELRVRRHELVARQRELADASAERRSLTPEEARQWLELLTEQTERILAGLRELAQADARLEDVERHLDEPAAAAHLEELARTVAQTTVPPSVRSHSQPASHQLPASPATKLGERLRAELAERSPDAKDRDGPDDLPVETDEAQEAETIPIRRE